MTISKFQAQSLVNLAIWSRPLGAPRWDEQGVMAAITRLVRAGWKFPALRDEVIRHADDPNAKTPGVIGSGYKPPREQHSRHGSLHPRADEACEHGLYADTCPWPHEGHDIRTGDPHAGAAAARQAIRPTRTSQTAALGD